MLDRDMHRRRFLQTSGLAAAGIAAVQAVQVGAILIDPRPARAMATAALNDQQAQTLLVMARQLFPYDELGDQYYVAVVEALDAKAAADPAFAQLLAAGVSELDAAM